MNDMDAAEKYDVLVLGADTAGKLTASTMAQKVLRPTHSKI